MKNLRRNFNRFCFQHRDKGIPNLMLYICLGSGITTFASMMIVFITAVLTGVGIFDKIGQYGGAGAFVPISGFANAMVSPAMEFKREGLVLGLGCKLFTIAGPVLVWGVTSSVIVGLIYAIFPW